MSNKTKSNLRVGLLNMMADGALKATERQFTRLISGSSVKASTELNIFSLDELPRSESAHQYIADYYLKFGAIKEWGLDALIITGVNLMDPTLETQPFWNPLQEVFAWAEKNVVSTLCSCLATHAVMQFHFDQKRSPLGSKLWGVFEQDLKRPDHPLLHGLSSRISIPHSRHNDISEGQFRAAGLDVLVAGGGAGVHLAASADLKLVLMQGHPEYDTISLLKEYKREVAYYHDGARSGFPPHLVGLLMNQGMILLEDHRLEVMKATEMGRALPDFPEAQVLSHLENRWAEPIATFFANWLNLVAEASPKF